MRGIVVLLLVAAAATAVTDRAVRTHQQARFDAEVARVDAAIVARMTAYEQVLRGGLGVFRASDRVTREEWRRYTATLRLDARYPGFKSLSWAPAVRPRDLGAFVARTRAEPPLPGVGPDALRGYAVRPPPDTGESRGPARLHTPIHFVAPYTPINRRVLGVDMIREPVRRAAMVRSVRTGEPILTPRVRLSGTPGRDSGFIAFLAVVRDGRTAGWLTAAFVTEEFMRGLFAGAATALDYEVRDGEGPGNGALLHSTAGVTADRAPRPLTGRGGAFRRTSTIELPGRRWTVEHVASADFVPLASRAAPWGVLALGLLATLLFSLVSHGRDRWRAQAELLAEQADGLRRARAQAEAATRANEAFLATMSHEIRTPLNAVVGLSDALADGDLAGEHAAQAQVIRASAAHLLDVVNGVLDASRLQAGRVDLEDVPVDVRACAHGAVELVSTAAREQGVALGVEVDDDVPDWVRGDAARLRQVLVNLVANAVRFTPAGGRARLRVRRRGTDLVLAVHDTGVGVAPEDMERLFEPYQQVGRGTDGAHGGSGLGLSIVARLVEAMGGTVQVESTPGVGSTFRVVVPVVAVDAPAADDGAADARPLAETHPLRVLVAEDSEANRMVARHLLGRLGYTPEVVTDGERAVEAVARAVFDVVLLDIRMPGMDGTEAAREIRRRCPDPDGPRLVAMSAGVLAVEREAARDAGLEDFLPKPVTVEALAEVLRRCPRRPTVTAPEPARP